MSYPDFVNDLVNLARIGAAASTDYALAEALGVSHATVSNWRSGRSAPAGRLIERVSDLAGLDPHVVLIQLEAWRADRFGRDPKLAALWRRAAERIAGAAVVALFALLAPHEAKADAIDAARTAADPQVCTMRIARAWLRRKVLQVQQVGICQPFLREG